MHPQLYCDVVQILIEPVKRDVQTYAKFRLLQMKSIGDVVIATSGGISSQLEPAAQKYDVDLVLYPPAAL